ncbi:sensor histidine kinase [Psychroserpens ponticola]|uniref:histidine kinase n=1 Tax=Psychroserpens ponticola TaxID=2932268 RepID=A0ABY7S0V4_9FLAO|nr:PAS domain-containing sensor histidine kinase [Psychroserpens ponticola]WCO03025.1 PAS domain-containing sensor histidine kinase [Psychroserpens ponticola]
MKRLVKKLSSVKTKKNHTPIDHLENLDELKWKFALENSNVGLWDWNASTNEVFYSKETKQLIGYQDSEIKNAQIQWDKRVHPDDREAYFKDYIAHINGTLDHYKNEHRILCKDGTYKWVLDRGKVVLRDKNNKPIRIIGTVADITQRKKSEELLNNNLGLITHQNKRLHNFTHIVSHNLKTHIGNFKNILEFYDESTTENEKEELVGHLKTISEALTNTIVDLNDIINIKSKSSIEQINQKINIFSCANKIIKSLELESQQKEISIHNAIREIDHIKTNTSYFESILHNLISNGIKYSHPDRKSKIILQTIHTSDAIKILISDNGIGIDLDKYKNQLFEMYQTFHGTNREDSRGIGLYITKTQVEALDGKIELSSKLDEGSTFTLTFKK